MDHPILSAIIIGTKTTASFLAYPINKWGTVAQNTTTAVCQTVRQYGRVFLLCALLVGCALLTTLQVGAQDQAQAQGNGTIPGAIRVIKKTVPATPGVRFYFTLRRSGPILHLFALRHLGRKTFDGLEAGHGYKITEVTPAGWAQSSATCNDGSAVTNIHVQDGETVTCTFVNVQLGKLIVKQLTLPDSDSNTTFSLATGGGLSPATFTLGNGETRTFANLMPGTNYRLSETALPGWAIGSAACSNGNSVDRITIEAGQTVTCTFTATQLGKLIVRKATTPNPDFTNTQFQFSAGGGLTPTTFALHSNELQSFANLAARSGYTVAEQSNTDWRLATATCDNNSSPTNIRVDPGQTVTCTFTNEATAIRFDLTMSDNEIVAEPGDTIVYTLHYRNGGNQDATGAFIQMQVPPFTTFAGPSPLWSCPLGATAGTQCTYTIGTLSGGVTAGQVQFKARVNQTVPANVSQIDSTATLGYSAMANAAVSSEQTPLKAIVGLSLQKDDGGVSVSATDYVTYTLTYGNSGTQAAANVTISETVPANTSFTGPTGLWSCASGSPAGTHCFHNVGTVNAGNGGTVPFVIQVNESLPTAVEAIDNSATIGSSTQPNSDFGTERTELLATPDLVLRLVAIDVAVSPGQLLHYRISYLNQGSQGASGVTLTALLPEHVQFSAANSSDGWQCVNTTCQLAIGTLASGSSGVVDFALLLDRPIPAGLTTITLTAQVSDDGQNGPESATENNHASVETAVIAPTDFFATKQDSLVVDADGDGVVSPGDTIEYTIVLRNNSGAGLRQIVVTDPLDANLQLIGSITTDHGTIVEGNHTADRRVVVQVGDLAGAGGSATIRFRTTIRTPLPVGIGTVQNQATISSPDFTNRLTDDPDTADRRDATVTAVHTTVALQATLRDTLLVDADHNGKVTVGDTIVYELFLQNHSNVDADLLSLVVPLDANVVLLPQSVATSYGEVAEGSDGEHQMEIVMDGLAATASVQATFQVKIVNPTTSIQHQAVIWSAGVGGQEAGTSDDPDTDTPGDATVTVVASTDTVTYQLYLPEVHR